MKVAKARERTLNTRSTVLRVRGAHQPSFSDILEEAYTYFDRAGNLTDRTKRLRGSKKAVEQPASHRGSGKNREKSPATTKRTMEPTIIVPNSTSSMLTLSNVVSLLQNSVYVLTFLSLARLPPALSYGNFQSHWFQDFPRHILILTTFLRFFSSRYAPADATVPTMTGETFFNYRNSDGTTTKYRVVDSATRFTDEDWKSVVAIFTVGKEWQFADWKVHTDIAWGF